MSATADYMDLMANLVSTAPDEEALEIEWIRGQRAAIDNIACIVRDTPLFRENQEAYRGFINELDKITDPRKRLKSVWAHILERTYHAPTSMHVRGVVIMCLPALKHALDRYNTEVRNEQ